ncbi:MAG: PQQ-binding-like beta-propeller repeat protein [Eubacteriaceae bacterium]|nr:PQQ-binding-like beta-propeller repeat protein [Eubacteriaceae bacterium]
MAILACLIFAFLFFGFAPRAYAAEQIGTVTFSVECFSVGKGYVVEPVILPIYAGDTVKSVTERKLGNTAVFDAADDGKGLVSVTNGDKADQKSDIPVYITALTQNKATNDTLNATMPALQKGSYIDTSRWVYSVNNTYPQVRMDQLTLSDGDVVRVMFSLTGNGLDVGNLDAGNPGTEIADRMPITKLLAQTLSRGDYAQMAQKAFVAEAVNNAKTKTADLETIKADMDAATARLQGALDLSPLSAVAFAEKTLTLTVGEEHGLSVVTEPAGLVLTEGVNITSDHPETVSVNGTVVKAVAPGTAVVTVEFYGMKGECAVTVKAPEPSKNTPGSQNNTDQNKNSGENSAKSSDVSGDQSVNTGDMPSKYANDDSATVGEASEEDTATAYALVQRVRALNAEAEPTLGDVQALNDAYLGLNASQKMLLSTELRAAVEKAITDGYARAYALEDGKLGILTDKIHEEIAADGKIGDATLLELVSADKAVTDMQERGNDKQNKIAQMRAKINRLIEEVTEINHRDGDVKVVDTDKTLPWYVKITAETKTASEDELKQLSEDNRYVNPVVVANYRVIARDFSQATTVDDVPLYQTAPDDLKITLPAKEFDSSSSKNLTLINGDDYIGYRYRENDQWQNLITYRFLENNFSFTFDRLGDLMIISDSRVPVSDYDLTNDNYTLRIGEEDKFVLGTQNQKPADTTDMDRAQFTTSNQKVITVNKDGVVTAKDPGTAAVSVSVDGVVKTCQVTVLAEENEASAYFPTFRKNNSNMAVVNAKLPKDNDEFYQIWSNSEIVPNGLSTCGTPLVIGNYIYVPTQNKKLYCLDKSTGAIVAQTNLNSNIGFFSFATYGDGMIFVPESNGVIEAFDAMTLERVWISENISGQSICQVTYHDGYVYSGVWSGTGGGSGVFYCVDATRERGKADEVGGVRKVKWQSTDNGGFYWAGACVVGNYVVYGGDSGRLYVADHETGAVIASVNTGSSIRSAIAYDEATKAVYFSSTTVSGGYGGSDGKCFKVPINADTGALGTPSSTDLISGSTSTPVVYNGRVYLTTNNAAGSSVGADSTVIDQNSKTNGKMAVIDASTMKLIYNADLGGPSKASPLLTTYYEDNKHTVYLYVTVNNKDGAVVRVKDYAGNTTPDSKVIYTPPSSEQQYVTTSLNCDSDGTVYYRNDRGHLIALFNTNGQPKPEPIIERVTEKEIVNRNTQTVRTIRTTNQVGGSSASRTAAKSSSNNQNSGWGFDTQYDTKSNIVTGSGWSSDEQLLEGEKRASALIGTVIFGLACVYAIMVAVAMKGKKFFLKK